MRGCQTGETLLRSDSSNWMRILALSIIFFPWNQNIDSPFQFFWLQLFYWPYLWICIFHFYSNFIILSYRSYSRNGIGMINYLPTNPVPQKISIKPNILQWNHLFRFFYKLIKVLRDWLQASYTAVVLFAYFDVKNNHPNEQPLIG